MTIALIFAGFFFAVLGGVSVGWILCEMHRRAHPTGIDKVAASAAEQVTIARQDCERQVKRLEVWHESEVASLTIALSEAHRLIRSPEKPYTPPPAPAPTIAPEDQVGRVTGNGVSEDTALRDALLERGFSPGDADSVLRGDLDDIPPGGLLDQMATGIIAKRTAVT